MKELYTITAFSENHIGLLNRITIVFTRRHINIESLTVSATEIKGIHRFTIAVEETKEQVEKVTAQIEKLPEVIRAEYYVNDEIVYREIALYKFTTSVASTYFLNVSCNNNRNKLLQILSYLNNNHYGYL